MAWLLTHAMHSTFCQGNYPWPLNLSLYRNWCRNVLDKNVLCIGWVTIQVIYHSLNEMDWTYTFWDMTKIIRGGLTFLEEFIFLMGYSSWSSCPLWKILTLHPNLYIPYWVHIYHWLKCSYLKFTILCFHRVGMYRFFLE